MRFIVMPTGTRPEDLSGIHSQRNTPSLTNDRLVHGVPISVWSGIEISCNIIFSCLAVLRPLLAKMFPDVVQTMPKLPATISKHRYEKIDNNRYHEYSIDVPRWEIDSLAKTMEIYQTIELKHENRKRRTISE
jgi:hypothetical protein